MKKRSRISVLFGVLVASGVLVTGCATVRTPEVQPVPGERPQVSRTVAAEQPGKKYLKRKVAVARFSNETVYGQEFWVDENKDRIGKQASDILSANGSLSVAGDLDLLSGKLSAEDIEALGTVKAKNIEAEETIKGDNLELGDETRGKAEIEAGDKEAEIETKAVSNSSQIYITPLGKLGGGNLYVDMEDIKEGKSFKVKLDGEELDSDIEFNWLIIK